MAANLYKPRPTTSMLRAPGADAGASLANSRSLTPGSTVMGRYTIEKVIGRGGMATVYLAKNQETERLVALKILDPEISSDPSYVERFRREARAAGRIRSDHVVAIYDLGLDESGTLVLVMEYLEGSTVQQALRNGRMPLPRAMILGRQLCEGLAAAHENGVIHRDLKPANLFIERLTGGAEKLKVLDFGISKLAEASSQELTRAGQTLGTLAYMAPEQIRGTVKGNDPRIDLYSAGVSLFLMFTAKRPIDAEDTVQLLQAVLEKPALSLSQAAGVEFPPSVEAFIAKALVKDPTRRYQTALEMRDALLDAAHHAGIDAIAHFSSPNAQPSAPRVSAPPMPTPSSGVKTVMEPAPSFTPPSGVIVAPDPSRPVPNLTLPSFDDEEEEGKTVVRAPTMPPPHSAAPSSPLPLAGRRPTPPRGMPAGIPEAPAPSVPSRGAPTMPPNGMMQPPGMPQPNARAQTLLGMPGAPEGPMSDASQGTSEAPPTQAIDIFSGQPGANFPPPPPMTALNSPFAPSPMGAPMEPEAPAKRSPMKFVLLGASMIALALVSVAGYVATHKPPATETTAVMQAPRPVAPAIAAQPSVPAPAPVAQQVVAAPAPELAPGVAQPLAPAAQQLAPAVQPAVQPAAQPEAPAQQVAEASAPEPAEPAPAHAHTGRGHHARPADDAANARQPAAPVRAPVHAQAAPRPPVAQAAATPARAPRGPRRPPRGPITVMPF